MSLLSGVLLQTISALWEASNPDSPFLVRQAAVLLYRPDPTLAYGAVQGVSIEGHSETVEGKRSTHLTGSSRQEA